MGNLKISILTFLLAFAGIIALQAQSITSLPKANKVFSVYAYICLNQDEQPVTTPADIQDLIDVANATFAPIGFSFNVCQYIDVPDYRYRTIDRDINIQELIDLHYHPEVINMYFTDTAEGDIDGFAFLPGEEDVVVLDSDAFKQGATVIQHQLGHFFGLYHTSEIAYGLERANGTNCQVAGDSICDTPADPVGADFDQNTCQHKFPVVDILGVKYAPPYDNYMSTAPCGCRFTVQQFQRMYNVYTTRRNYLK